MDTARQRPICRGMATSKSVAQDGVGLQLSHVNESLMFNTGNLSKQTLEVWVWDEVVVKADDVIGVAKFNLSELVDGDHGDGETGTGTGNVTRRVTLPLAKPEGKSSFLSKLFGCCAAQGEGGNLGTVTLELEFKRSTTNE